MAPRNSAAPQVMAYWLTSASIAAFAASFNSGGQEKSGKPCARLMPLCCRHRRVISRMTDSVNVSPFALTRCPMAAGEGAGAACGKGAAGAGAGSGAELTDPSCRVVRAGRERLPPVEPVGIARAVVALQLLQRFVRPFEGLGDAGPRGHRVRLPARRVPELRAQ